MIFHQILYLVAGVCFILSLKFLSSAESASKGNYFGIAGITIAIVTTLCSHSSQKIWLIFLAISIGGFIGTIIAKKIKMASLPQLVAGFHSLVGLAAVLVAGAVLYAPNIFNVGQRDNIMLSSLFEIGIGTIIGSVTFTGSFVAFAKLQGILKRFLVIKKPKAVNAVLGGLCFISLILFIGTQSCYVFWALTLIACVLGLGLIIPIGGSDMPVVVSMLNSYSGWAIVATGFTLNNHLLIITGAIVGSSGAILSYIMCKNMNRSIIKVLFGGLGTSDSGAGTSKNEKPVKIIGSEDVAFFLNNSSSVIIVPGYGMAVAQAQHAVHEITSLLSKNGVKVRFAIHPVAGRMPGHMNVLLAEANVSYDSVFELDNINSDFRTTDIAFIVGANDITNPAAYNDKTSPIYGMPILDVEKARNVIFLKRSLGAGYSGVDNELFYKDNTMMVLGDAKKVCEQIVKFLK